MIGQERAKKILSVAVHNHYKRIELKLDKNDVELQKSNILMIGPTGSGKTLLAQTLARILNVPFTIADATTLTEAGYVGEDVENILVSLIQAADYDIEKASRGIVYIDEIDKIAKKSDSPSITREFPVKGSSRRSSRFWKGPWRMFLPKAGESTRSRNSSRSTPPISFLSVGGAFNYLETIIHSRIGVKGLGFGAEIRSKEDREHRRDPGRIQPEDLIKFGMIPEFVGRLPVIATLNELTEDELVSILTEPKNALVKQYKKLFELEDVRLRFTDGALRAIAKEAIRRKSGARGLRSIMENIMLDIMYDLPSHPEIQECIINEDVDLEEGAARCCSTMARAGIRLVAPTT